VTCGGVRWQGNFSFVGSELGLTDFWSISLEKRLKTESFSPWKTVWWRLDNHSRDGFPFGNWRQGRLPPFLYGSCAATIACLEWFVELQFHGVRVHKPAKTIEFRPFPYSCRWEIRCTCGTLLLIHPPWILITSPFRWHEPERLTQFPKPDSDRSPSNDNISPILWTLRDREKRRLAEETIRW